MTDRTRFISIAFDERRLRERNRNLAVLLEMSNCLSSGTNLGEALTGVLQRVLLHFHLDGGRIYLPDRTSRYLHLVAYAGLDPSGLERVSMDGSFSGKAFRTKTLLAQYVSELEDEERAELLLSRGFKVVICVPLIVRDKVEGVMNLTSSRMLKLDRGKVDLLTTIGNQIAVAASNMKLYEDLQDKVKDLEEKKETIKFFAYSISHDLKSPATALYGLTRRLKERHGAKLDGKAMVCCEQIMKTAEHMALLVDKINVYIAAKEAPLDLEKMNFKEIVDDIHGEFAPALEERGIKWSEPQSFPEIVGDKLALERVFRNLVDNALKYGGEDLLEIKIGYRENRETHIFSLTDDGIGIRPEYREKIFEIFHRDGTSRGVAGSGLGLAIVREIAERHGGAAWVEESGKTGTTFCISISKNVN